MCVRVKHLWKTEGDFQNLVSPSTVGSGDCAQVIWLSWSVLYLLRYSSTHKHRCRHKHECSKCNYVLCKKKKKTHMAMLLSYLKLFSGKQGPWDRRHCFHTGSALASAWPGSRFLFGFVSYQSCLP